MRTWFFTLMGLAYSTQSFAADRVFCYPSGLAGDEEYYFESLFDDLKSCSVGIAKKDGTPRWETAQSCEIKKNDEQWHFKFKIEKASYTVTVGKEIPAEFSEGLLQSGDATRELKCEYR